MLTNLVFKECGGAGVPQLQDPSGKLRSDQLQPWQEELNAKYEAYVHRNGGEIEFTVPVGNLPRRYMVRVEKNGRRSPTLHLDPITSLTPRGSTSVVPAKPPASEPWTAGFLAAVERRMAALPLRSADRTCVQFVLEDLRDLIQRDGDAGHGQVLDLVLFAAYLHRLKGSLDDSADASRKDLYTIASRLIDRHYQKLFEEDGNALALPMYPADGPDVEPTHWLSRLARSFWG